MSTTGLPGKVSACGLCGSWNLHPILDMGMQPLPERHDSDERYPQVLLECKADRYNHSPDQGATHE